MANIENGMSSIIFLSLLFWHQCFDSDMICNGPNWWTVNGNFLGDSSNCLKTKPRVQISDQIKFTVFFSSAVFIECTVSTMNFPSGTEKMNYQCFLHWEIVRMELKKPNRKHNGRNKNIKLFLIYRFTMTVVAIKCFIFYRYCLC